VLLELSAHGKVERAESRRAKSLGRKGAGSFHYCLLVSRHVSRGPLLALFTPRVLW
jgi:hypothetical protein